MSLAIYPGSFDPITNGHIDIIQRAKKLFGNVIVAVIDNPDKKMVFTTAQRIEMIKECIGGENDIEVDSFSGLLVEYAKKKNTSIIIRGLRAVSDFDYEFQMALTNRRINKEIETVFLMTGYKYSYLSSSLVRQIYKLGGSVEGLVPECIEKSLKLMQAESK